MLARRFTVICLIAMVFAYALISLIERSSRPAYSWKVQSEFPCVFERAGICAVPRQSSATGVDQ
ncbi:MULTISPECIES: hypothetical protein [unclassified Roseitalea]|uniref:hypothetical protein n=1 Tax=unclassified Roseitalea TaxID=2639107 RepID=UPI0027402BE3|nr:MULTISPECIES: hypothetical protein [unclassified Roseitalea]